MCVCVKMPNCNSFPRGASSFNIFADWFIEAEPAFLDQEHDAGSDGLRLSQDIETLHSRRYLPVFTATSRRNLSFKQRVVRSI